MNIKSFSSIPEVLRYIENSIVHLGKYISPKKWQGKDISDKPEFGMYELLNTSFTIQLPENPMGNEKLFAQTGANNPWAEDHFQERVSGLPINPGNEWKNWPYSKSADTHRGPEGKFTHTYMERYWPKFANSEISPNSHNRGIRYDIGDIWDVITLLVNEPDTRQAYIPVWFPEDTGVTHGGRVPCTLGYHIIQRYGYIHIVYYIRSCDIVRHLRDDIYLTIRLLYYFLEQLKKQDPTFWNSVKIGSYTQHTTSMHCFTNDHKILWKKIKSSER